MMEEQGKLLGLDFTFVEAVDGKLLNHSELTRLGVKIFPYVYNYSGEEINMAEVGCALSHYSVWKDAEEKNFESVLILEDDVRFEADSVERIEQLMREVRQFEDKWDLCYISRDLRHDDVEKYVNGSNKVVYVKYSYLTQAYALTKKGINKLMAANYLQNLIVVDEFLPIMYDSHSDDKLKQIFPRRDMIAVGTDELSILMRNFQDKSDTFEFSV